MAMKNVLDTILDHLKRKNRNTITSVFDLAELIMARCLGLNFNKVEWDHERYTDLEIYEYSVNYVVSPPVPHNLSRDAGSDHIRPMRKYAASTTS